MDYLIIFGEIIKWIPKYLVEIYDKTQSLAQSLLFFWVQHLNLHWSLSLPAVFHWASEIISDYSSGTNPRVKSETGSGCSQGIQCSNARTDLLPTSLFIAIFDIFWLLWIMHCWHTLSQPLLILIKHWKQQIFK